MINLFCTSHLALVLFHCHNVLVMVYFDTCIQYVQLFKTPSIGYMI